MSTKEEWSLPQGPIVVSQGRHIGKVAKITDKYVIQDVGRGNQMVHDKSKLDKVPAVGEKADFQYGSNGLAKLVEPALHDRHGVSVSMNTR